MGLWGSSGSANRRFPNTLVLYLFLEEIHTPSVLTWPRHVSITIGELTVVVTNHTLTNTKALANINQ